MAAMLLPAIEKRNGTLQPRPALESACSSALVEGIPSTGLDLVGRILTNTCY